MLEALIALHQLVHLARDPVRREVQQPFAERLVVPVGDGDDVAAVRRAEEDVARLLVFVGHVPRHDAARVQLVLHDVADLERVRRRTLLARVAQLVGRQALVDPGDRDGPHELRSDAEEVAGALDTVVDARRRRRLARPGRRLGARRRTACLRKRPACVARARWLGRQLVELLLYRLHAPVGFHTPLNVPREVNLRLCRRRLRHGREMPKPCPAC